MSELSSIVQEQSLTLTGKKAHYWKGGSGPALLLLHAAWGDADMSWNRVWEQLAQSYTVIAPDLPGFGQAEKLSTPTLSGMATMLKELLGALHQDRIMVVGNSFGAGVAIKFENDHPHMVSRLVLVDGGYMPVIPGFMKKLVSLPGVNRGFRALIRKLTFSKKTLMRSFANPAKLPSGFFDEIEQNTMAYSGIAFDTIMNHAVPLSKPTAPTLLVWGAEDGLATLKQADALQKWIPGARLITIDGAGHMPQVEKPEEFVKAVIAMVSA
jgi:pimeloyl-ACP methyl ester carboxylesterase